MSFRLSRSLRMKLLATGAAGVLFLAIYEGVMMDSRTALVETASETAAPSPGRLLRFDVTAYCKGETTASGVKVRPGIAASDPALLPAGSIIRIEGVPEAYEGIYTVLDTGPEVQGRELDIYIWSCFEALDFGRRKAAVTVLRMGWDPKASVH
ncbi:MAG: 3D domain-containing protein [Acidobacteria bacterium]|jgi:3D (Asp-Asp-Asp) domain-containing protein|nr:3D domain-containing protein [Acidobacteriota bacterium]